MPTKDISYYFSYGLPIGILNQFLVEGHLMARNREQEVSFVYVIETQSVVSIGCHKVNLSRHILQRGDEDSPADQILFPQAFKAKFTCPFFLNDFKE